MHNNYSSNHWEPTSLIGDSTNPGNFREFEKSYFCNCRSNRNINEISFDKPFFFTQMSPVTVGYLQIIAKTPSPDIAIQVTCTSLCTHVSSLLQSSRFTDFYRPKLVLYTSCLYPLPLLLRCIYRHSRQRTNSRFHNAEHCGCLEITFTLRLTSLTKHLACFVGTDVKISETATQIVGRLCFWCFLHKCLGNKRIVLFYINSLLFPKKQRKKRFITSSEGHFWWILLSDENK